jgi:magnesium transporter
MNVATVTPILCDYLANGDPESIRSALEHQHAADIADCLDELEAGDATRILLLLPERRRAEVFGYFEPATQVDIARQLPRSDLVRLVTAMSHDERADLFNRLSPEQQQALLPGIAHAEREDIRRLASYPEGTAGSIMTSDYATLAPALTAREALEVLRREAPDKETIYDSYVVNEQRQLLGVVSLRDLLLADGNARVADLMRKDVIFARAQDPREEVARKIADYDLLALPIINGGDMLVGIVTADDAMDVEIERANRDFRRLGAVAVQERIGDRGTSLAGVNLKDAGIWLLYRMRIFWLVILVFGNLFSGAGIAVYEHTIEAHVALVFFLPLLIASGGNAGAQAATLMVRALGTGDVHLRDWTTMIGREVLVAGLLGVTMALAVSVIGLARGGPHIAFVVAASMVLIVLVGSTIGMSLPFLLSRFKMEPASASAPLITSLCDGVGVLIYFAIATAVLPPLAAG